jgi:hypothetical protein
VPRWPPQVPRADVVQPALTATTGVASAFPASSREDVIHLESRGHYDHAFFNTLIGSPTPTKRETRLGIAADTPQTRAMRPN